MSNVVARTLIDTLADTLPEKDNETIADTVGNVKSEELTQR